MKKQTDINANCYAVTKSLQRLCLIHVIIFVEKCERFWKHCFNIKSFQLVVKKTLTVIKLNK